MKAITCTQCGAIINDVSEASLIIDCDYCGAKIMIPSRPIEHKTEQGSEPIQYEEIPSTAVVSRNLFTRVIAAVAIIPIGIAIISVATRRERPDPPLTLTRTTPVPVTYPTYQAPVVQQEPEPEYPVVNYQPRISWDGPNDLEYFDSPEVDISSVRHLTSEEVKKTVFKNRTVKLKVIINTEGEIDEAEVISGHPLLADAAVASAKRTIFSSRKKPTTRVLTYTYRVLKD